MGIDFGSKRVGIAVTDASRCFIFGRPTLKRTTAAADLAALGALAATEGAVLVAVGLPLNADGSEGGAAKAARAFAAQVGAATALPVVLVDERYTTIEAEETLRERYRDRDDRRDRIDMAAATIILRTFLDHGPIQ